MRQTHSILLSLSLWLLIPITSYAVVLEAANDEYGIPSNQFLSVESFGVLENDIIDGEAAVDAGATATLVSSVSNGTLSCPTNASLQLCADGSFDYTPGAGFTGSDSFEYQAHAPTGEVSNAIVNLSACEFDSASAIYTCWQESAYLSKLAELGYGDTNLIREGFEGSAWGGVRSDTSNTNAAWGITSKGILWTTNFPSTNQITTSSGGVNSGFWGAYDPLHGSAVLGPGNEDFCDVDDPVPNCLPYDGLSGSGTGLFAVGGYFSGVNSGGSISIIFDSGDPVNIGSLAIGPPQFFGAIKPAGFSTFQFREENGKTGQENPVFGDDFIFATSAIQAPNTAPTLTAIGAQSIDENVLLTLDLTANDVDDGDFWRISADGLPLGAMFEDNEDGTATFSWRPGFDQSGIHSVTFTVTDNGFPVKTDSETVSITVIDVPDTTKPVITLLGNNPESVVEGSTYSDAGATASDNIDGDISVDIVVTGSVDTNTIGGYLLSYNVSDAAGNAATTVTRTVNVTAIIDPNAPEVSAPAYIIVDSEGSVTAVDIGQAEAIDDIDDILSATASNSGPFAPGRHQIVWSATDSAGNTGSAIQIVDVRPIVEFMPDQVSEAEEDVKVKVGLNGDAAMYPVEINYDVFENDGAIPVSSGSVSISNGITKRFEYLLPQHLQTGKVTFKMTSATNAVIGSKDLHTVTVVEDNIGPLATLEVYQKGQLTRIIAGDHGTATVKASVADVNPSNGHIFDWSKSDNVLLASSPGSTDSEFTFDPEQLSPGHYKLGVKVTDDGQPNLDAEVELYIWVIGLAPELGSNDSDDDGIDDGIEGIFDDDNNGIPDYLDGLDHPSHLQGETGIIDRWLLSVQAGLKVNLGLTSLLSENLAAIVNEEDISLLGSIAGGTVPADSIDDYEFPGGIFDFEISGLQIPGQSVLVVIPQHASIPEHAVYRKYTASLGWQDFVEDTNNKVFSAAGESGICPSPGDSGYTSGLTEGHHCVQLLLEDGGSNDADTLINGVIKDPGGVGVLKQSTPVTVPATTTPTITPVTSITSGSGSSGGSGRLDIVILMILVTLLTFSQLLKPGLKSKEVN